MSEESSRKPSQVLGASLIIAAALVLFVGIIGYVWARGGLEKQEIQSAEIAGTYPQARTQPNGPGNAPDQIVPQATAIAPPLPTPIATTIPTVVSLPLPTFENPVDERLEDEAAGWNAAFAVVDSQNSGVWQYEANNFVHPIAMEVDRSRAFLIDAGRVLAINLLKPEPPILILSPGDEIGGVRVLEPLDLALVDGELFVLDRAGDVYWYDIAGDTWEMDRYDRPVEASSGHYFVAIDVPGVPDVDGEPDRPRTLLETNYQFAMQYLGEKESLWNLPEARSVDVSNQNEDVYVLQREMFNPTGIVTKYRNTRSIKEFAPAIEIDTPRQIVATDTAVFILDRDGKRLLTLDPDTGALLQLTQLPQQDPISVFAFDTAGELYLAGRDRLYFVDQFERLAAVPGGPVLEGLQLHDPEVLKGLNDFTVPIGGSNITFRDFQMPGAPRHYRLGVHEGLDLYWAPGTKVVAAADGLVIRADIDYVDPTAFDIANWWNATQEQGYTTPEMLDNYMGRQVWIQHAGGLVSRYGHLRSIEPGIVEGVEVSRGQAVGEVGNSGSPASLESPSSDAHLHFELWLADQFLGQYLRPVEAREWIEMIFPNR